MHPLSKVVPTGHVVQPKAAPSVEREPGGPAELPVEAGDDEAGPPERAGLERFE